MSKTSKKPGQFTTPAGGRFATTHWSVVLAAGKSSAPEHRRALSTLCSIYWFPLYAYLRRQGYKAHEAEDYTQAFFAELLDKHFLKDVHPSKGRFRSFLLVAVKHFVSKERKYASAKKRGGGRKVFSLDFENAEQRYHLEPESKQLSADRLFERSWALTVLERAMGRLESEATTEAKRRLFEMLKDHLAADRASIPYRELAEDLETSEGAVKVAAHRLRRRFREVLRDEIAQTVTSEGQIDDEIRDLFSALGG